jgi:hypothetical protein
MRTFVMATIGYALWMKGKTRNARKKAEDFLRCELNLNVNPNVNLINPVHKGVSYLGVDLWSSGRRLDRDATE